ncbi:hypothetical protein SAMN05216215_103312 [Saccharopolyspora shandongensis]|uniref:Uncharacterized protein n=1 Tax=Saccharopolyspora shandongensis TaxID=418495 RepID=A0A1H3M2A5_9PSEU|nr:hypothetical protein SAMN05216215_103312 [Saccharopolyspora shandongensis]
MSDLTFAFLLVVVLAVTLGTGLWWLLLGGVDSERPEGKK